MDAAHDSLTLAFFLAGRGGARRGERGRGAEAGMGPDPQGCVGQIVSTTTQERDR
jgi:hypothetical protein